MCSGRKCKSESRQHENADLGKYTSDDRHFQQKTLSDRFEKAAPLRNEFIPWVMIAVRCGESVLVYTFAATTMG